MRSHPTFAYIYALLIKFANYARNAQNSDIICLLASFYLFDFCFVFIRSLYGYEINTRLDTWESLLFVVFLICDLRSERVRFHGRYSWCVSDEHTMMLKPFYVWCARQGYRALHSESALAAPGYLTGLASGWKLCQYLHKRRWFYV